jgi:hypothetical protein
MWSWSEYACESANAAGPTQVAALGHSVTPPVAVYCVQNVSVAFMATPHGVLLVEKVEGAQEWIEHCRRFR